MIPRITDCSYFQFLTPSKLHPLRTSLKINSRMRIGQHRISAPGFRWRQRHLLASPPPPGPRSIMWSAHFMMSRLCSITTTVFPRSTSLCISRNEFLYIHRNEARQTVRQAHREFFRWLFSRVPWRVLYLCASPPERVVTCWPNLT